MAYNLPLTNESWDVFIVADVPTGSVTFYFYNKCSAGSVVFCRGRFGSGTAISVSDGGVGGFSEIARSGSLAVQKDSGRRYISTMTVRCWTFAAYNAGDKNIFRFRFFYKGIVPVFADCRIFDEISKGVYVVCGLFL